MRKKKRTKQDIKHLKASIKIWFCVLVPASCLAYLADVYVFKEYVYELDKDAFYCDPNSTGFAQVRYCDNLGEQITGKVRSVHNIGDKEGHYAYLLKDGKPEYEWFYLDGKLLQEDDMGWMRWGEDDPKVHNLKFYRSDGTLKLHVKHEKIFTTEMTYDESGKLVGEYYEMRIPGKDPVVYRIDRNITK